jgi:hypothetical protein
MQEYQNLANRYYTEYQKQSVIQFQDDLKKWDSVKNTILNMHISQRAQFADYVTKKMCANHPKITLEYTRLEIIPMLKTINYKGVNTCAIGNIAAHLMLLPENERAQYL